MNFLNSCGKRLQGSGPHKVDRFMVFHLVLSLSGYGGPSGDEVGTKVPEFIYIELP